MISEDYERLETKIDKILDITSGIRADQAAHTARLDSVEKETDQQNDRLIGQEVRIRKTETSLSRIWGGIALIGATGIGISGAFWAWIKDAIGVGNA